MAEKHGKRLGLTTAVSIGVVITLWGAAVAAVAYSVAVGTFQTVWSTLGDGQAQIISSAIAALGLITSAILVPFVFKDRIRDLDGAVSEMQGKIVGFEKDASDRLDKLTALLDARMADIERRSDEDVDRIGGVLEEIRSAVILSVSGGQISDPKHAKVFVRHLYNDAVAALQRRIAKRRFREARREHIASFKMMSTQYLDALMDAQVISSDERKIIDVVRDLAYRRNGFMLSDISIINRTRIDFDAAFSDSAVQDADVG